MNMTDHAAPRPVGREEFIERLLATALLFKSWHTPDRLGWIDSESLEAIAEAYEALGRLEGWAGHHTFRPMTAESVKLALYGLETKRRLLREYKDERVAAQAKPAKGKDDALITPPQSVRTLVRIKPLFSEAEARDMLADPEARDRYIEVGRPLLRRWNLIPRDG